MISLIIVDDEGDILDLAREFLERPGDMRVETATTASRAMEMHRDRPFDAIVSDYQMPGMDGIEFLKKIRGGGDTTPFIILTGRGREQVAMEALNLGADLYLQKGGDPRALFSELAIMVRKLVENHHAGRESLAAEERIRVSEGLYRTTFETAGAALAILDRNGIILRANREIEPLLGFKPVELEGKISWQSLLPPDELPRFTEYFRLLHEEPDRPFRNYEARLLDRWGKPRHGIISVKLIPHTGNCVISVTDITGLRMADEKIRASESLYRTIFSTTGAATVILDENGTILLANREVETILGFPPAELEGRAHWSAFIPPDELPRAGEFWRLLHEDPASSSQHYDARFVDRWGNTRHGMVSVALIPGSRNCVASVVDITEQERALEDLGESRERYRTLAETTPDMIYLLDPKGIVQYVNSSAARRLRKDSRDIIGRHLTELFPEKNALSHLDQIGQVSSSRQVICREVLDEFPDGPTWVSVRLAPVLDPSGEVSGILGISQDITERKRTEEALRESEEKYRTLVEKAADGIVVIQDRAIVFCNTRAAEMWGGVPADLVGRQFMDFIDRAEVPGVLELYEKGLAGQTAPQIYDILLTRRDGSIFHAGVHAGVIPYGRKPAILVFIRDITERKQGEEALLTAHRKLNLLSSITRHDIRNQLMVILGYTELLRQDPGTRQSERIVAAVEGAARIIQQYIDFTREYQEIGIHAPAWQDVREVILRARAPFRAGKVRIAVDLDGIDLYADPLLERVFANLIENALKHGDTLTTIRFFSEESDQGLAITCEDDGKGIPPEDKERIFSPGFGGTSGYGLFLVREILGITGISIQERGTPGKGAGFRILVPPGAFRVHR